MDEQSWGNNRWTRGLFALVWLGLVVTVLFFGEPATDWLFLLPLTLVIVLAARHDVRITPDELIVRYPIGGYRIPRADVLSARFNYFGLVIQLRSGATAFAFATPKLTSAELSSGGQPEPGGAAYEITRWAERHTA
ncbi:PH domain-containing protein [Kribbella sandramycini]|uniref:PH domain-containing protein n=1 Tax=Kribbella sandramycini TaxID=60450 RepID=A0A7Y4L4M0_9ACTN|nr:PH domain-containing protein [Kribbella sandramycini]MBB6571615.1 hypothetical protein [Kribbella sandramycini]NOL44260.1 PH domain-containing protein [Kribbella sandramycini]